MTHYPDHFGGHAANYARFRPTYPESLYQALVEVVPHRGLAWDCGTGNGQVAVRLAQDFQAVYASDISEKQLGQATPHPRVSYHCGSAENSELERGSVALITAAAAVHWFDLDRFYAEAQRVLDPGGVIAVWSYTGDLNGVPAIGELVRRFGKVVLAEDWPPGFERLANGYASLPFPFQEVPMPALSLDRPWSFDELLGFVGTWSALPRYRERTGEDPLGVFEKELAESWPESLGNSVELQMPLNLRVGRPH